MSIALVVSDALAISNYNSLVEEASDHLDRDDLTDKWPRFVQMVESYLKRRLRVLDMEEVSQASVTSEDVSLPDDCLSIRSISIDAAPDRPLRAVSPAEIASEFGGWAGPPVAYARIGNAIRLAPPPDEECTLTIVYLAAFTPLTTNSVTNWVLNNHPDIYFYGILAFACDFIQDSAGMQRYSALFEGSVQSLVDARNADRWGSRLRIPSDVAQVGSARC